MRIEEIVINSKEYPEKLKNIYDSPQKLYILGNKKLLSQRGIAIVGARKATEYGKKTAYKFAKELAENNFNIISGLAKGIDTYAHLGAIQAQIGQKSIHKIGKTIAIMGSGFNNIYPKENIELARKIIKSGGCIITEYSAETKPEKLNFPKRNRIISGLSKGIIVIEAKEKSGTLITVDFALEQGRDVFVVPGNINSINSVGTNDLIRQGAKIVTSYEDVE